MTTATKASRFSTAAVTLVLTVMFFTGGLSALAQETPPLRTEGSVAPDTGLATAIIDSWEERMRGDASRGEMEMYIQKWNRTLTMHFEELYPDRSLVRVLSPASDAGTGSLKIGPDLWSYNPRIDQVQKIPPSLMLDGWMGSDFTNDDISRTSSIRKDYDVQVPVASSVAGVATWRVTLTPRPESPVVWEKIVVEAARDDFRPLVQEFYDEDMKLARRMVFTDYRKLDDGRNYPFVWRMENVQEKGRYTEIRVKSMEFLKTLPESRFSVRSLKQGR